MYGGVFLSTQSTQAFSNSQKIESSRVRSFGDSSTESKLDGEMETEKQHEHEHKSENISDLKRALRSSKTAKSARNQSSCSERKAGSNSESSSPELDQQTPVAQPTASQPSEKKPTEPRTKKRTPLERKWHFCREHVAKALRDNKSGATIARELREKFGSRAPCTRTVFDLMFVMRPTPGSDQRRLRASSPRMTSSKVHMKLPNIKRMREFIKRQVTNERKSSVIDIYKQLKSAFGAQALSLKTVYKWVYRFQGGEQSFDEDEYTTTQTTSGGGGGCGEQDNLPIIDAKFRRAIRLGVSLNKTPSTIYKELCNAYGNEAPCLKTVIRWSKRYKWSEQVRKMDIGRSQSSRNQNLDINKNTTDDHNLDVIFIQPPPTTAPTTSDQLVTSIVESSTPSRESEQQSVMVMNMPRILRVESCPRNVAVEEEWKKRNGCERKEGDESSSSEVKEKESPGDSSGSSTIRATSSVSSSNSSSRECLFSNSLTGSVEKATRTTSVEGRVADRIIGDGWLNGERYFMVKWKNSITKDLMLASTFKQQYPRLVMDYYEDQLTELATLNDSMANR